VQFEFPRIAKLSKASAQADKVRPSCREAESHRSFRDIVDATLLQAKAMCIVLPVDQMHEIFSLGYRERKWTGMTWRGQKLLTI
jgi:hypothetical protein